MIATEHSQSLSDFLGAATETIERVHNTGEVEILTVDGEARAVLLSPAVYDELIREVLLNRDVAAIRESMQQIKEGKCSDAEEFFDELRSELLAMKAAQSKGPTG